MGTSDANGIYFYETTDPVSPLQTLLNTGQQSVSDAFSGRSRLTRSVAASPPVSPTPVAGDVWFQTDTKARGIYDGSVWQIFDSVWQTYTPLMYAGTNVISIGNGTITGRYFRTGKMCRVRGSILTGSTTNPGVVGGATGFGLPFTSVTAASNGFASGINTPEGQFRLVNTTFSIDGAVIQPAGVTAYMCMIVWFIGLKAGGGFSGADYNTFVSSVSYGLNGVGAAVNLDFTYQMA